MVLRVRCTFLFRIAYLIFLMQIKILNVSSTKYATSITLMADLLSLQNDLIENLSDYAKLMQEKMDTINLALSTLSAEHSKQTDDPEEFLANPLNSFALMRRMHLDWPKYHEFMKEPIGQDKIDFFESVQDKLPTAEDYKEALTGFLQLQELYKIDEQDMARGYLDGTQYEAKLTVPDCLALGNFLDSKKAHKKALKWFRIALQFYDASYAKLYEMQGGALADIWYNIADQLTDMSEDTEGLEAINRALDLRPNDSKFEKFRSDIVTFLTHERLCSKGKPPTGKHLHCRYNATTHPYFKLGPLKMEELSIDPYITIYHNFVNENEMKEIRSNALPFLHRGLIGDAEISLERVASQFSLLNDTSDSVNRVSRRIDLMSGHDNEYCELSVFNYGIGGHHYCHIDNQMNPDQINPMAGHRKLIVLVYLKDVVDGGSLVFPTLDIAVPPEKGLALQFPTLDNAGNVEQRTMHASCPVMFGTKWTLLKLYLVNPQMFRLPCYK